MLQHHCSRVCAKHTALGRDQKLEIVNEHILFCLMECFVSGAHLYCYCSLLGTQHHLTSFSIINTLPFYSP